MGLSLGATSRYTLGILALLSVVCIWVGSSFLMNNIFAGQHYNKPFFVTYVNTGSFSLYLLGPILRRWWSSEEQQPFYKQKSVSSSSLIGAVSTTSSPASSPVKASMHHYTSEPPSPALVEAGGEASTHHDDGEPPMTIREIAQVSFTFCILWFAANWCTNASLAYTTVASSTILASMSGFFTLAIGAFMKTELFSTLKLLAVCSSVIGVILVSKSDHGGELNEPTQPSAPLFGDFLALLSAMFYGCYTVLLKVRIQNESRVNMPLFFGFVGLFNLALLWPVFGILHWTGIEPFELPQGSRIVWMIAINALVGTFVSDYLWLLSMLMTSPLVVTLGLSLTIPLALLGDVVGYGRVLGTGYWIGAGLVLAGFFGVNGVTLSEQGALDAKDSAAIQGDAARRHAMEDSEVVAIQSAAASAPAAVAAATLIADERMPLLHHTSGTPSS